MLPLLALLVPLASAGDQALYEHAVELLGDHYLRAEILSAPTLFGEAGKRLEAQIEWLLVKSSPGLLQLRAGQGDWKAEVRLVNDGDLPAALARLEDAVRGAGFPISADIDVRVEILRGVARALDRHSVVLHGDGLERFDERLSGTLTGIGATISVDDDGLYIRDLVPDGPAAKGGARIDDRLVSVDGVSTVGMVPSDATDRIRGPAGTQVVLALRRGETPVRLVLSRRAITIRNVTASRGPRDVAVVTIDHFSDQTRAYLLESLAELAEQGILDNGLVIDLRGNTGGSLIQSAQAADTFLGAGLIVSTAGRDGRPVPSLIPRMEAHPDTPAYTMPIAVLMDPSTASGSEILAGALAKLDRAILVGTNSFGKGTVQKLYHLDPTIKLKLTVAEYLLEGGTHVMDVGLQPDVALSAVRFFEGGVWYPSPTRERKRLPAATRLIPYVADDDAPLEVAATLVSSTRGAARSDLLAAAKQLDPSLIAEADTKVIAAFKERNIDWTAATQPVDGEPAVEVQWAFDTPPTAGRPAELRATVTNRGPDLLRAAIRLESTNPLWEDRVLPLGRLPRGATRTGTVRVEVDPGEPDRTDRVTVHLEADRMTPHALASREFRVLGVEGPAISVVARAGAPDSAGEVVLTVDAENKSAAFLTGLTARIAFPDVEGIELVDPVSKPVSVPARGVAQLKLRVQVRPTWTEQMLPFHLKISAPGQPELAAWDVEVPRDGSPLRLEAPTLTLLESPPTLLPTGTTRLRIRASDDRALDHVVVLAGPDTMNRTRAEPHLEHGEEKIAWRSSAARRTELEVMLPVVAGTNHYRIVAEDREGLRTVRDVYVYGDDGGAGISAAPD